MSRRICCLLLVLIAALTCTAIAMADAGQTDDYAAALETLSAAGVSASSELVLGGGNSLQLSIELGMLSDGAGISLTQLSTQAVQLRQEQELARSESVAQAAATAALLVQYDGVLIKAPLYLRAEPSTDAAVLRTLSAGKVAHLLGAADGWYQVEFGTSAGYVSADFCQPVHYDDYEGTWATATLAEDLLQFAMTYLGTPYVYGGVSRSGIDCSGFTMMVFAQFGYRLAHGATDQYYASRRISDSEREPGDLVFFNTTGGISHVGIYLGGGQFIHASSSRGVMISSLYQSYYAAAYLGAGRIIN